MQLNCTVSGTPCGHGNSGKRVNVCIVQDEPHRVECGNSDAPQSKVSVAIQTPSVQDTYLMYTYHVCQGGVGG